MLNLFRSLLVTKTRSCQEPLTIDDLDPRLQKALANVQINNVSSVQGLMAAQVINSDVDYILYEGLGMGCSTGIIIGIFQWLIKKNQAASPPSVLILTPTHELAIVLFGLIDGIAPGTAAPVSKDIEITDLSNVDIIVGTPGTLHQCHTDRKIFFSTIRLVV